MRSRVGLTLVEVAVSMTILLIAVVGSLVAVQKGFELLDLARNTTTADQILQSELEDIRLCSWAKIGALPASGAISLPAELDNRFSGTRQIEVVRTNMKRITISVQWQDYKGRTHKRSYQTLFTQFGLNDYFVTNRTS